MSQRFQGNKAIKHPLITNDPGYQRMAMLYNVLAQKVGKDPRSLNASTRQSISRANNLLNAESTKLFLPNLRKVEQLYKDYPDLKNVPYEVALSLVRGPLNKTASEMRMVRGWDRGEVHHGVPAGAVSATTASLPYENWGDSLYGAGRKMPITSQAYSGLAPLSGPAHNIAHYDLINRQFYKGEGSQGGNLILPSTSKADAIYQLTDQLKPNLIMSRYAGEVDNKFLKELAYLLKEDTGLKVKPSDLKSSIYHPEGRGATFASFYNKFTPGLVDEAIKASYGTTNPVEGATRVLGVNNVRTEREAKDVRNLKAKQSRERKRLGITPTEALPALIDRPGTKEMMNSMGINYKNVMSLPFS